MTATLAPAPDAPRTVVRTARAAPARRHRAVLGGLALLLLGVVAVRVLLGDFTVTIPDFVRILLGTEIPGASYIVMEVKLPRAVLAVLCGAAFGFAGAVFQAVLRNPLASPDIIGLNLGASAAAVVAIVALDLTGPVVPVVAVAGGVLVALGVRWGAGRRARGSAYRLVLVGVAAAAALQSLIQYVFTRADVYDAQQLLQWLAGSVSAANWETIRWLAALLVLLSPVLVLGGRWLPALELGPDAAAGLGVRASRADLLLLGAVVVAAVAVAASGPLAFVAFMAGPAARALNGGRTTLAGAALAGAVLVVGADFVADYLVPGGNYPVGVVTGAVGAPFLLWLLTRGRGSRRSA